MDWPADKVERRDVDGLLAYRNNPRTHSPAQIEQIANSITAFGFAMPVLVDEDGMLIAGHARVTAARKLKLTTVPTMVARGWTDDQKRAYVIADNKLSLNAGWNDDLLRLEFGGLTDANFDLALTGFSVKELTAIMAADPTKGLTDPDAVPPPAAVPRPQTGEVWKLGRHTLYCADCLEVLPSLDSVDAVITDPPYGIGLKYDQHDDSDYGAAGYGAWIWKIISQAEALCPPGAPVFIWQSPKTIREWGLWFPRSWQLFCGARNFSAGITSGAPMYLAYDAILAWWKDGGEPWCARTNNRDWHVADTASVVSKPDNLQRAHPCPRPVDQVLHIIEQWVEPGHTILEPFCGSGTTLLTAEMSGRTCVAIELSPVYCDIAIRRWEAFTGKQAELMEMTDAAAAA